MVGCWAPAWRNFNEAVKSLPQRTQFGSSLTERYCQELCAKKIAVSEKDLDYQKMRAMRDDLKAVESLRKAAEQLACDGQYPQREEER